MVELMACGRADVRAYLFGASDHSAVDDGVHATGFSMQPYHPMRLNMFDKKKNNQVVFTVDRSVLSSPMVVSFVFVDSAMPLHNAIRLP